MKRAPIPRITDAGHTLYHKGQKHAVVQGEVVPDFRGDDCVVTGGHAPRSENSEGRIFTEQGVYFPSVCKLEWRKDEVVA